MKYIDYKERKTQGRFNFPVAFYHQTPKSPRYEMQYHWHTYYEIIHIVSGSFHLNLDNEIRTYYPGDVIFVSDGMLHGGSPSDCVYECILFDMQMLFKENHACSKELRNILDHKIRIHSFLSEGSKRILPVVQALSHTLSSKRYGYEFMVQGYLYQLLGIILEEQLYEEPDTFAVLERFTSMKKVLEYISDNYYSNITLDTLSKIAGMNPRYFCRYFKSMTDRTPIDYLNYYRIECACEMLSTKDITLKEAAISCGFNDESYFIRTFRKYKGITPKQFMKMDF
ncbi:MAG: helix-turn-helix transcriptional regulator [Lachnospiraceae bacterium]|nr:helix-turn-helix transcriptional regulator [Lachnospiraceae bacterium]